MFFFLFFSPSLPSLSPSAYGTQEAFSLSAIISEGFSGQNCFLTKDERQRIDTLLGNWNTSVLAFAVSLSVLKCGRKKRREDELSSLANCILCCTKNNVTAVRVLAPSQILTLGVQFAQISFAKVAVHFSFTSMSSTGRFP